MIRLSAKISDALCHLHARWEHTLALQHDVRAFAQKSLQREVWDRQP